MSTGSLALIVTVAVIISVATLIVMRSHTRTHEKTPADKTASSFVTAVVVVSLSLVLIVLLSAAYTTYAVQSSQQKWCDTLRLLTSHGVQPSESHILYTDFLTLKDRFGC